MNKLHEISELLKDAEDKVESLKAELRATTIDLPEYDPTWKPDAGDTYFLINEGEVICEHAWSNHAIDIHRLRCNNAFKSGEEAWLYLKIFNRVHELNDRDPVDWSNVNVAKYYFYYDIRQETIIIDWWRGNKAQGTTHMTPATMNKIRAEFTDKELEVWVRR